MREIINCSLERHGEAILRILNEAITTSTALYDYQPRTRATIESWFATKAGAGHPIFGIESGTGELMGFATFGPFRPQAAYKYTVEHSVYVDSGYRGSGVGRQLLRALIERARLDELHLLIGVIDSANQASITLHESMGFVHSGTLRQAGFKFGDWLDVAFYQLALPTPSNPRDG